jgi:dihydroneopterin aldolase
MKIRNRKIFINNLELMASIGVYEEEKKNKQKIIINLEILMTNETEPKDDNLKETQDYSQFRKAAKDIVNSQHFQLLEVLTNKIHLIINEKKFVVGYRVTICKPDIFNDCEVAYEISNI